MHGNLSLSPGASSSVDRSPQEAGILTAMMPSIAASTPAMFMFTTLSPCHGGMTCRSSDRSYSTSPSLLTVHLFDALLQHLHSLSAEIQLATPGRKTTLHSLLVGHHSAELEEDGLACARMRHATPCCFQPPATSLHDHVDALAKASLPKGPVPAPMHEETACKRLAFVLAIIVAPSLQSSWHR